MQIEVDNLTEAGRTFEHTYAPGEIDFEEENARQSGDLVVKARARRKGEQVRLNGKVAGNVEVACDRCLTPVNVSVDVDFDLQYVPTGADADSSENAELQAEDLELAVFEGPTLDFDDVVREQVLLAIPTRLLCREECKGLCSNCGADLNTEECGCERHEVDPRWAGLAALKRNSNQE